MSLHKAIESGKEHRKEYKYKSNYSKSVDSSCMNHGNCSYCKGNRLYQSEKLRRKTEYDLKEVRRCQR